MKLEQGKVRRKDIFFSLQAYPSADLEICLLGSHPFIGATQIAVADDTVVLLSKVESSTTKWVQCKAFTKWKTPQQGEYNITHVQSGELYYKRCMMHV